MKTVDYLFLSILLSSLVSSFAFAQSPLPAAMLFPWQILQMPAELVANSRKSLKDTEKDLAKQLFKQPVQTLDEHHKQDNLSIVRAQQFATITTGSLQISTNADTTLIVEPSLCPMADRYVLLLRAMDLKSGLLLDAQHTSVKKSEWLQAAKKPTALTELLISKVKAMMSNLKLQASVTADTTLQVGISEGSRLLREDQGNSSCLNDLVAEKLVHQGYKVIAGESSELFVGIHDYYLEGSKVARATRNLTFVWSVEAKNASKALTFPVSFQVKILPSEAVFTHQYEALKELPWKFSITSTGAISFGLIPELLALLSEEKTNLSTAVDPSIMKVYGAWVYLDKGRAWGLKINDRLMVKGNEDKIKGHVIGYYGPTEGIVKSGQLIQEGAVVFIRKGQSLTEIGQQLILDPTQYPTP